MAKTPAKKTSRPAKEPPLITLIRRCQEAAEQVAPLLSRQAERPGPGAYDAEQIRLQACRLISAGLDAAQKNGLDRHAVAAEMARLTGLDTINASRLNKLAAPSQEGYSPKPAELVGLRWACDDTRMIAYLAELCGLHLVTPAEYALIELGRIVQASSEVDKAKATLLAKVCEAGS